MITFGKANKVCIESEKDFFSMYREYEKELSQYSERLRNELLTDQEIHSMWLSSDNAVYFLVDEKEEAIAFAVIGTKKNTLPNTEWFIQEFYVKPEYRRQGLGTRLFEELTEIYVRAVCMFILDKNEKALAFWQKTTAQFGFSDVSDSYYDICTPPDAKQYVFITENGKFLMALYGHPLPPSRSKE